eukprot:gene29246-36263_t
MALVKDLLDSFSTLKEVLSDTTSTSMEEQYIFNKLFNNKESRVLTISKGRSKPPLSGSSFHSHKHTVNELLQGAKHWYIYPPHKFPPPSGFNPGVNVGPWMINILPTLSVESRPVEIIQRPGEIVYIPEGWYHATHTIRIANETEVDSISVSHFMQEDTSSSSSSHATSSSGRVSGGHNHRHYMSDGLKKEAEQDFTGAVKMYTLGLALCRDITLLQHLGDLHKRQGSYNLAEVVFREVLDRNPLDLKGYVQLVGVLLSKGSDESKAIGEVLDRAEKFDLKEEIGSIFTFLDELQLMMFYGKYSDDIALARKRSKGEGEEEWDQDAVYWDK